MNMTCATPETVGISSENILKYIEELEASNLSTHNVIIARGDKIICEKYWDPLMLIFSTGCIPCQKVSLHWRWALQSKTGFCR